MLDPHTQLGLGLDDSNHPDRWAESETVTAPIVMSLTFSPTPPQTSADSPAATGPVGFRVTMARTAPTPPAHTLVLLVRHGTTPSTGQVLPGRAPGLHLSERGRAQAEAAAARIAVLGRVDAVYASPLERTRETAAPIARARTLRVQADRGLLECDFGEWTGAELKRLAKLPEWRTVQRSPSAFRFPGGESFTEMQARMVATVQRLAAAHPGGTIVCVSHADPIKAFVAHAVGSHLDMFQRLVISPCSVTAVAMPPDSPPVVLTVNSTGEALAELRPS